MSNISVSSAFMESRVFTSAVSLEKPARSRKSRKPLTSPPIHVSSLVPVSSRPMTDFSISKILSLESNETEQKTTSTALTVYNRNSSQSLRPERNCGNSSPQSSSSDYANSTSDCDSEPDRFPTYSEKRAKKKRQRTTFSMFEVWELERAYMKRPYLMPEDEEDLEKRLGITARSLRYWFQNRRAKSRRDGKMIASDFQKNPSNQFEKPPQTLTQSPLNCWRQADRLSYPGTGNFIGKLNAYSRPIRTGNGQPSVRTDHLSKRSSFFVPMFHPDQFRRRQVALIRPADSRGSKRYQPY
ncbi:unnamed protein product [Pocillopora meandrina]|uniref:Homeobox domain-containing protein n=1 Tax=Pocillopora meandrina TaxID=46732 RepID=A0AAU9XEE3_9CNID|nr:unnamed protein product [Pocillopora meandrina]